MKLIMNSNKITSLTNLKVKNLIKLLSKKGMDESSSFLSFDINVIKEAYKLHLLKEVYSIEELNLNVPSYLLDKKVIDKIKKDAKHIGIISFLESKKITGNTIVYLDEIRDPSNLGKIIYLMNKHHIKDLIISTNCTSIYNSKCLDIAKTDIFNVNINYGDYKTIKYLKEKGYQIVSTGLKNAIYLSDAKLNKKKVIVFGNEAHGVNESILNESDLVIKIPIKNIDSFNVSVAASIVISNIDIN